MARVFPETSKTVVIRAVAPCFAAMLLLLAGCDSALTFPGTQARTAPPSRPVVTAPGLPPVVAPAPTSPDLSQPREPVRVAMLVPLSGQHAPIGEALLNAAMLAVFDAGNPSLVLMPHDTKGTAEGAQAAAAQAIADGAKLVLGPLLSANARAVAPQLNGAGINLIAFSNDRSIAAPGLYVMGFLPGTQVERVVAFATSRGLARLAALVPRSAYGAAVEEALRETAARVGASVVQVEAYDPASGDVSASVRRIARYDARRAAAEAQRSALEAQAESDEAAKQALAELAKVETVGDLPYDALLIAEGGQKLRLIAPLLAYYEIDTGAVRLLGTGQWDDPSTLRESAVVGGWFAAPAPAPRAAFEERFAQTFGKAPPRVATLGYDAAALAAALARGASPDYGTAALTNPSGFYGVDGLFRFLSNGLAQRGLAVLEVQSGGFDVIDPAPQTFEGLRF